MALAKAGEKVVDGVGELKVLVTEVLFEAVLKWNIVRCNLR